MKKLVGLSLSLCIRDMASGVVDPNAVEKIIAGTRIINNDDFKYVIETYNKTYWKKYPNAEGIARSFWKQNKIDQPRIRGEELIPIFTGYWKEL